MLERMYRLPDLSKIRFRTRTLIEGLIGLGTLKPGEVPELMRALQQHAIAPAFQERLLESLFMLKEDRIKDVNRVVAGQLNFLESQVTKLTVQAKRGFSEKKNRFNSRILS